MDFIEDLPKSQGKDVILEVVDRLTKYAHFLALSHPYNVQKVADLFMDNIVKCMVLLLQLLVTETLSSLASSGKRCLVLSTSLEVQFSTSS
jgi:hypothetical protein